MNLRIGIALGVLAACKNAAPPEPAPGSAIAAVSVIDAAVIVPDASPDAAVPTDADPSAKAKDVEHPEYDLVIDTPHEVEKSADILTTDGVGISGDMEKRGVDLNSEIDWARTKGLNTPPGPRGRISIASKEALGTTSLTVDQVLAKMQAAYMAGLKRCYKAALAKTPTAAGALTIELTVESTGRVVTSAVTGFDAEVARCIAGQSKSWRFPVPTTPDGPAAASFRFGLNLIPD